MFEWLKRKKKTEDIEQEIVSDEQIASAGDEPEPDKKPDTIPDDSLESDRESELIPTSIDEISSEQFSDPDPYGESDQEISKQLQNESEIETAVQVEENIDNTEQKPEEPEPEPEKKKKKPGFFARFFGNLFKSIDDDFYEELEEQLIMGDMGVYATEELIDNLKDEVTVNKTLKTAEDAKNFLMADIRRMMEIPDGAYDFENKKSVVMLIGVNGVGKTTCVGKLARRYLDSGKKVIMAGADTFRAAAMDQLKVWAERTGCYMVSGNEGADPGSVVYDAAQAAKARGADILLCDTAGRLHNKKNLMNELAKLDKILSSEAPDYARENLIVLDATTGQNALQQAKEFRDVMKVDGIVLTKLDGTAKGGIAVAITRELGVPVKYVGVGEGVNDLIRFDPETYVNDLFSE